MAAPVPAGRSNTPIQGLAGPSTPPQARPSTPVGSAVQYSPIQAPSAGTVPSPHTLEDPFITPPPTIPPYDPSTNDSDRSSSHYDEPGPSLHPTRTLLHGRAYELSSAGAYTDRGALGTGRVDDEIEPAARGDVRHKPEVNPGEPSAAAGRSNRASFPSVAPTTGAIRKARHASHPSVGGQIITDEERSITPVSGDSPLVVERETVVDRKHEVMAAWLSTQQEEKMWTEGGPEEGVVLKRAKDRFVCAPAHLADVEQGLYQAVKELNVQVAMTVNTAVIKLLLQFKSESSIEVRPGLSVQVLPDITYLPRCQKHQFAAFIADWDRLVVWDDNPRTILDRISGIEAALVDMVWSSGVKTLGDVGKNGDNSSGCDIEAGKEQVRKLVFFQSFSTAATLMLAMAAQGSGWRELALQSAVDHTYLRLLLLLVAFPQFWVSLFFFQALVGNLAQCAGPIGQVHKNSKYYSAIPPRRLSRAHGQLPCITIQCPVYKEGLKTVLEPTILSIKQAISTYEMQGGTAHLFINDDGMRVISDEDAQMRRDYYEEHNIGWVARPPHNPDGKDGGMTFTRRGRFKKASNMNFALWVSQRIEDKLLAVQRSETWSQNDEIEAYKRAMEEVKDEEATVMAAGDIRIGDYILLLDADTRLPADCLLDAVSEMEQSPEVAILQYTSGVMNVTDTFFERGITYFTKLIFTQIRFAVANGDVAPFIGHNAVLRWRALQEVAYDCQLDKREKYWSEETVSEDFDMALRLQTDGYITRLAAYAGEGFKEGVSLTVYDELNRWEKYAFGCSELVFHPLSRWPFRGPFTKLFWGFITSGIPLHSKFTITAYIGTYYAIGSAWILSLMNYFVTGWFNGHIDHFYLDSFRTYFSIIIVFSALGNIALSALRYRTGERPLLDSLVENFKWVPLLALFLGGVSLHVSQAILGHLFGVNMTWGATMKEEEHITFFEEIPRVLKRFKMTFTFCIFLTAMMIFMAFWAPEFWQIRLFIAVFPLGIVVLGHMMLPIVLNPNLMLFTW